MTAIEYLVKLKEERGESFRALARKTGRSDSFWWLQMEGGKTPTLENARKFADALKLNEDETKNVINVVFKERLIHFLEKEGALSNNPTSEIRSIIKALRKWHPEKGQKSRYIMLTLEKIYGPEIAKKITELGGKGLNVNKDCLTGKERTLDFEEGLLVELAECSKGSGGLGI